MKFNDRFKINPLICCMGMTDEEAGGYGGTGKDSDGGYGGDDNSDSGSNTGWYNREAVNAVNSPDDYAYANDLVETAQELEKSLGISAAKAFAKAVAAFAAGGPIGGILTGIKGYNDLSKEKQEAIEAAVKDLVEKNNLDATRAKEIAGYLENSLNSHPTSNTSNNSDGNESFDWSNINIADIAAAGQSTTSTTSTTLDSNLAETLGSSDTTTTDTTGTDYQYDSDTRQAMTDYFNSFYDSALADYQEKANQIQDAVDKQNSNLDSLSESTQANAEDYSSTLTTANDKYQSILDGLIQQVESNVGDYRDAVNAANTKQGSLLDDLISQVQGDATTMRAGNNLDPVSFSAGGNTISFIPRANRDTASQISDLDQLVASLGQQGFDNSTSVADSIYNAESSSTDQTSSLSQNQYDSSQSTAAGILEALQAANDTQSENGQTQLLNSIVASESSSTDDYLEKLQELAEMENNAITTDSGLEIQQQQADNDDPGTLDTILGYATLMKGASSIFDW